MSSQTTDPPTLGDQQAAIAALFSVSWAAPHLPALALISITAYTPVGLDLSTRSLADFEQWRQVIKGDPQTVELNSYSNDTWLRVRGRINGIAVNLTAHFEPATPANTSEPAAAVLV